LSREKSTTETERQSGEEVEHMYGEQGTEEIVHFGLSL
jgi:hypothetical protein